MVEEEKRYRQYIRDTKIAEQVDKKIAKNTAKDAMKSYREAAPLRRAAAIENIKQERSAKRSSYLALPKEERKAIREQKAKERKPRVPRSRNFPATVSRLDQFKDYVTKTLGKQRTSKAKTVYTDVKFPTGFQQSKDFVDDDTTGKLF